MGFFLKKKLCSFFLVFVLLKFKAWAFLFYLLWFTKIIYLLFYHSEWIFGILNCVKLFNMQRFFMKNCIFKNEVHSMGGFIDKKNTEQGYLL